MSAARHVHQLDDRERNPLAIINMVLAVAAATIWLVALPAAREHTAWMAKQQAVTQGREVTPTAEKR